MSGLLRPAFTAALALAALVLLAALPALDPSARKVPIVLLVPTLAALAAQLAIDLRRARPADPVADAPPSGGEVYAIAVVAGVVAATDLLGLRIALSGGLFLLLAARARVGVIPSGVAAGLLLAFIELGLDRAMGVLLPTGRLWAWLR